MVPVSLGAGHAGVGFWALYPGVIESTSNYVEHPQVVADRLANIIGTVGDKEREGDGRTPEGRYTIDGRNEVSLFGQMATLSYHPDANSARDTNMRLIGVGWAHWLAWRLLWK